MSKDYGQFCGLAKAARVLGERWALLVVRDLSVGPRRFNELSDGLPGVPSSVLTTRLRELESAGIVERRTAAHPQRGVLYALSHYGEGLRPVLDALGRWGARRMGAPESGDVITSSSLAAALRTAYRPGSIGTATTFLVHAGPATAWATAQGGELTVGTGLPESTPDLVIHAGPQFRQLLAGRMSAGDALAGKVVEIDGPEVVFEDFVSAFHVPLDDSADSHGFTPS